MPDDNFLPDDDSPKIRAGVAKFSEILKEQGSFKSKDVARLTEQHRRQFVLNAYGELGVIGFSGRMLPSDVKDPVLHLALQVIAQNAGLREQTEVTQEQLDAQYRRHGRVL